MLLHRLLWMDMMDISIGLNSSLLPNKQQAITQINVD